MRDRRTTARLAPDARAAAEARALIDALTVGYDVELRFAARLLVTELIANAVRHADLGRGPEITLECVTADDGVHVCLEDRGRGIAAALIDPRGDAGAGLGLVLLRDLAAASHVESDASGTRVRFTLVPQRPDAATCREQASGERPGLRA